MAGLATSCSHSIHIQYLRFTFHYGWISNCTYKELYQKIEEHLHSTMAGLATQTHSQAVKMIRRFTFHYGWISNPFQSR